jgi:long-chain acyl-CoA synthetase
MQLVATSPVLARYPAIVDRRESQITPQFRDSMRRDLLEGNANIVIVVPKILVAVEKRIRQRLASGGVGERIATHVIKNATQQLLADVNRPPSASIRLAYRAYTRLRKRVAQKIRDRMVGPGFQFFVCGGAKLPPETAAFFWALGLPVYEGYGSTETNCPIAVGTAKSNRIGSVGKLFSGVEIRVGPKTREILVRGPNVAQGYLGLPAESAATWTADGWYHTRDIGHFDADGFLHIEDRLDNILVLQNGEKVSAAEIEGRFAAIPFVDTAIVIGQQRPGLVALIALNEQAIRDWAGGDRPLRGSNGNSDSLLRGLIWQEIEEKVNQRASRGFERICNMAIIEPLRPDQRTLTATEKVARREIETRYRPLIERLYGECSIGLDGEFALASSLQRAAV